MGTPRTNFIALSTRTARDRDSNTIRLRNHQTTFEVPRNSAFLRNGARTRDAQAIAASQINAEGGITWRSCARKAARKTVVFKGFFVRQVDGLAIAGVMAYILASMEIVLLGTAAAEGWPEIGRA